MMTAPAMGEPDTNTGDYTIEITVSAANGITVSVEPASAEVEEPMEETGQSVPNIREAIKVVMDIYQNAGAQPDNSADAEMEQGFKPGL